MDQLDYEIVDVFTDTAFSGNPLAVVYGAQGLGAAALQAMANEFHLSETVFILPPTVAGATYRLRIFTPEAELPFAGHPSVGAAVAALRAGLIDLDATGRAEIRQECGAGVLPVLVEASGHATLTGGTAYLGPRLDPAPLLAAAGLHADDYAGVAPRVAGCGLNFVFLGVRPDAVSRAWVGQPVGSGEDVCIFAWDAAARRSVARVFVPGMGVPEDPATGSAALGFGVWLVGSGLLPADAASDYTVVQGEQMGRASRLECVVTAVAAAVTKATVRGAVVPVARGKIAIPVR